MCVYEIHTYVKQFWLVCDDIPSVFSVSAKGLVMVKLTHFSFRVIGGKGERKEKQERKGSLLLGELLSVHGTKQIRSQPDHPGATLESLQL